MKYVSTRDGSDFPRQFSFLDAVLEGLAPDGGLLVPESVPAITNEELQCWRSMSYQEVCFCVLRKFATPEEVPDQDLKRMISAAYTETFETPEVAPTVEVGEVKVIELFHGPTYAFKDVALQLLGQLFDFALRARNARMTILGATSGDTGSAAIAGVKGRPNIDCVILFPKGKTSKVQELQMTSNLDKNIHCLAVEDSVFDDCQSIVKSCLNDAIFNDEMSLGAVNSINWARILAQIVYFVYASLRGENESDEGMVFVVPTGNFGNVLAGYYAQRMGLPVDHLVIASNSNDILPKFFASGKYQVSAKVVPTMSPSMDIAVSSNFERYLYELFGRDGNVTSEKFMNLKSQGFFEVSQDELSECRKVFSAVAVDESETLVTIQDVFAKHGYLLCPHSAVGYAAAVKYAKTHPGSLVTALATAHIGKFTENILSNINMVHGDEIENMEKLREAVVKSVPEKLRKLENAETRRYDIANSVDAVKEYLRIHVRPKEKRIN
jgi:threonine synthase